MAKYVPICTKTFEIHFYTHKNLNFEPNKFTVIFNESMKHSIK